jgi:hypothetical protein
LVAIIQSQAKTSRSFLEGLIEADESILYSLATLATGDNSLQQAAEKLLISLLCILDTEGNYLCKLLAWIGDLSSLPLALKSKAGIMALATTTLNKRSVRLLIAKGVFSTLLTLSRDLFALIRKDPTLVIEEPKERLSTLAFFLKFFAKASHSIVVKDLLMASGGGTKHSFVEELFEFCDESLPNSFFYSSTLFEIYRESSSIIKNCCKAHKFFQEKVATSIVCALKKRLARVELEASPSPFLQSLLIELLSSNDKAFLTVKPPSGSGSTSSSSPSSLQNFIGLDTFLERDPKPTVDYVQKLFRSSSILTEKRVRLLNSFVLKSMPEVGESPQPSLSGASLSSELQWECLWKLKSPGTGWGNFKEKW